MFQTDNATSRDSADAVEKVDDRTKLRGLFDNNTPSFGVALAPNVLKSRFVLQDQLGSGGMGTVYRAKDLRKVEAQDSQPFLAIKVLNGDFRAHPDAFISLQREAAKSQSLSHRNIVKIFDFDKDGEVPFMTMELLQGNELSDLLREYPQGLPESLAWSVIRGFCSALKHAHAEGVIHADLKPGNLFVTHSGQVKIFDFGLARAVHANFSQGVLQTRSDVEDLIFDAAALGALTPAYASRAMLKGGSPGATDDVFAAALVIYQILTGKHPYGRIPADKVDPRSVSIERPKQLSSRQWRALLQALALEEEARLPSIALLQTALFDKSPRPIRLLATGLGVIAITLWFFNLQKDDEIRVVQQQAQQAGRVEAGVDRILELIQNPRFDAGWERQVKDELSRLAALKDSERVLGNATAQIASLYVQASMEHADLEVAMQIAERGSEFGNMAAAWESVSRRFLLRLENLLDMPEPKMSWLESTEAALDEFLKVAKGAHIRALAVQETNSTYLAVLRSEEALLPESVAKMIFQLLAEREFDLTAVEDAMTTRVAVEENVVNELLRDQAKIDVKTFGEAFSKRGCLVDELSALRKEHAEMRASQGISRSGLAARTDQLLAECVERLKVLDPDSAASFMHEAVSLFDHLPRTLAVRIDPCDRQYLVGSGLQRGRAGMCIDSGDSMPEMVVIPGKERPFAISRYEISQEQFGAYCRAVGLAECSLADGQLPVVGVSAEDARGYAEWLSRLTGFSYRLPTLEEWQSAAMPEGGTLDANMNCKVDIGGVSRGGTAVAVAVGSPNKYGLVNAFGNASEWVTQNEHYRSVGGDFNDSIEHCSTGIPEDTGGLGASAQGVRLARDIGTRTESRSP